ncbi:MAG: hypothetical protein JW912_04280 [Sedimentisphaerales bacterium]|nr:hypothetical protein [Sedimentisphaerales bacterium]
MGKKQYSGYQQDVISRYYDNLDTIMLGKLQEIVTDLYLADTKAKEKRLWERAEKAMIKLKIKPNLFEHIMGRKDVTILAKNLEDWLKTAGRK